jgi:hypothetical protein
VATRISTAARNAAVDAITALIDPSAAGVLRVYTGTQPAGPGTAPSGTLLLEFPLSDPAFAAASGGSAALDVTPIPADTGLAAGTAGWFRILTATEAAGTGLGIVDGAVTATGGGGELQLNTTTVSVGLEVEITSGTITMPAG